MIAKACPCSFIIVYTVAVNNLREVYVSAIESKIQLKNTSRVNVFPNELTIWKLGD